MIVESHCVRYAAPSIHVTDVQPAVTLCHQTHPCSITEHTLQSCLECTADYHCIGVVGLSIHTRIVRIWIYVQPAIVLCTVDGCTLSTHPIWDVVRSDNQ